MLYDCECNEQVDAVFNQYNHLCLQHNSIFWRRPARGIVGRKLSRLLDVLCGRSVGHVIDNLVSCHTALSVCSLLAELHSVCCIACNSVKLYAIVICARLS